MSDDPLRDNGPLRPYRGRRVALSAVYERTGEGLTDDSPPSLFRDVEVRLPDGTTLSVDHCWCLGPLPRATCDAATGSR
jgi:hypothetical protein